MIMYGLRHKVNGKLLGIDCEIAGEGACEVCLAYELIASGTAVWLVPDEQSAKAAISSVPWDLSSYRRPYHYYKPEELEIVEVKIEISPREVS